MSAFVAEWMVILFARTATGPGFKSWVAHLPIVGML